MILKNHGILGINARNLLYIRPYNPKKAIKLADDKIKTKQFLSAREVPVPKLYAIIKNSEELSKFDFGVLPHSFVLKPNNGYGGEGIIPIISQKNGLFITAGKKELTKQDLQDHINDILDGRFSISSISDSAFFEQYIISDERVGKYSYEGLPDIRVVVHNLIPVMAMLRLPTRESRGKANLHMGAVGIGIDIAKGEATHITYKNKIIDTLPDNLGTIRGAKIPYWDEILLIASKVQLVTNLGYMAVDIALDKNSGPVLLEINARAGLGVQVANLAPLRKRLERIEGVKVTTPTKGVRIAKDMFGNTVEKEIANISGKEIVGTEEEIELILKKGVMRLMVKIDTGKERSIIDEEIAEQAELLEDTDNYDDEKSTLKLKFNLKNKRIQTIADVERIPSKKFKMIIGARDLKNFLVDTNANIKEKNREGELRRTEERQAPKITQVKPKINFYDIDQKLLQIDNKIKLLYHLRPTNLEEEKTKFFNNTNYNPQFEYPSLKFDPLELVDQLNKIEIDDSPLGKLFEFKKNEISNKIALLEAIDQANFTDISISLFGKPEGEDIKKCLELIKELDKDESKSDKALYDAEEAKQKFEKVFNEYELKNWKVKIKEAMVADCVAGKNNRLFIRGDAKFSRERIESLIVHEIETHIITAENGKMQPYETFNRGLANYLTTQEGMAMYNVEKQRHVPFTTNYKALAHVIAINKAIDGSFSETFNHLISLGISEKQSFRSALKAKRGLSDTSKPGAFTKDFIYYKGYKQIKEFIKDGGQLKELYIGKFNIEDLETVKKIPGIKEARILPKWLK